MSQTIQQKQIEHFTRYAGSCLKIWKSIVGQQITHYRDGLGTVVGITKIDNRIYVEVLFTTRQEPKRSLGLNLPEFFTHLTFPRETEKELEIRYWNSEKRSDRYQKKLMDKMIGELRYLASQSSIDQSTYNTFNKNIYSVDENESKAKISRADYRKMNRYQQELMDRRLFSNLSEKAMNPTVEAYFPLPELNEDDIQLVGKWYPLLNNLAQNFINKVNKN